MNTPNIRTKNDESFKKGHSLTNEQKAIILHHTGYSDTTGVSKGMSKAMQGVNKQFSNPGESSHVVIDFDGTRYNYARPDQVTFHAGKSMMNGRDNVNDFGVGIEFQGDTDKTRLTDKQINSFVEYAGPIIKKNKIPLSSIITHKQIRTNYMKANPKDRDVLGKPDVNQIDYERIIKVLKKKGYYAQGGPVVDPMGQWAHPGEVTRIPGSDITMQGVNYPVLGVGSNGKKQMMYPGKDYSFGGAEHVDEYPMMQGGGLWNTDKKQWVDSIHNARREDLNFVQRLFDQSAGSVQIPGEHGRSTHFMESGDGRAYPTVVQKTNGQLQYLNQYDQDAARNYANRTGQYIQFPNDEQAQWYANSPDITKGYKMGTGVLKNIASGKQPLEKKHDIKVNYKK